MTSLREQMLQDQGQYLAAMRQLIARDLDAQIRWRQGLLEEARFALARRYDASPPGSAYP